MLMKTARLRIKLQGQDNGHEGNWRGTKNCRQREHSDRSRIIRLFYLRGNRNHKGHDDEGCRENQVMVCLRHRFGERNLIRQERETGLNNDSE